MQRKHMALEKKPSQTTLPKERHTMISLQFNNTISERDMDLLFVESITTDPGCASFVVSKTDLKGK